MYGLLGQLYYYLKEELHLMRSGNEFMEFLTGNNYYKGNATLWSSISHYDCFSNTSYHDAFKNVLKEDNFIGQIKLLLENISVSQYISINEKLIDIVNNVTEYGLYRTSNSNIPTKKYSKAIKEKLISHYKSSRGTAANFQHTIDYNIYCLIYLGIVKTLPVNFSFGLKYRQDLEEFSNYVLCRYGVTSNPGIKAIMELSEKGNMFALCEYGNMYYYGNRIYPKKDLNKAIEYYRKAAGVDDWENIDETKCNPFALWSLSYIYFNYKRRLDLKNAKNVHRLDLLDSNVRVEFAINYAKKTVELNDYTPAYNILGLIAQFANKEITRKHKLNDPLHYFQLAASRDYIYAYNNIAHLEKEAIFKDGNNQAEHLKKYLHYMAIAANKHENWAANKLGLFYLKGIVEHEDNKIILEEMIDKEKALEYFTKAVEHTADDNSIFAYANMILEFPERYKNNKELLKNHISIIRTRKDHKANEILNNDFHRVYGFDLTDLI